MNEPLRKTKARQGRSGWPVLLVLIGAFILLAVGWYAVETYGNMIEPANPVGDPAVEGEPAPGGEPAPAE